jgi:hypothetical protein
MSTPTNPDEDYRDQDSEPTTQAPPGERPTDPGPITEAREDDEDSSLSVNGF